MNISPRSPPPPYSPATASNQPPNYVRQPRMRTIAPPVDEVDSRAVDMIGKVEFGFIAAIWCMGCTVCCWMGFCKD